MNVKRTATKTIFIVNDELPMNALLSYLLKDLDVQVVTAECVTDAINLSREIAETGTEVLAFVDLMLPTTLSDLNAARSALEGRNRIIKGCVQAGCESEQKLRLVRKEIEAFDSQIDSLVDIKGGIAFLLASSGWIQNWRIVLMSYASKLFIASCNNLGIPFWKVLDVPVSLDNFRAIMDAFINDPR